MINHSVLTFEMCGPSHYTEADVKKLIFHFSRYNNKKKNQQIESRPPQRTKNARQTNPEVLP